MPDPLQRSRRRWCAHHLPEKSRTTLLVSDLRSTNACDGDDSVSPLRRNTHTNVVQEIPELTIVRTVLAAEIVEHETFDPEGVTLEKKFESRVRVIRDMVRMNGLDRSAAPS